MPHFIIEYSHDLERLISVDAMMQVAFDVGASSGIMQPGDIKVRAIGYNHFRLEGGIASFVHVSVYLLAGRTDVQKELLATLLRTALAEQFALIDSISIDIRDMNPVAYKKRLRSLAGGDGS